MQEREIYEWEYILSHIEMAVLDMQLMRYINLLDKASHVKTRKCFTHNNTIFFAVDKNEMSRAIGPGAINVRHMQEQLGKKVRIIKDLDGTSDLKRFVDDIVSPIKTKSVDVADDVVTISAGSTQNKAILIGRNKRRFEELRKIMHDYLGFNLKVV